MAAFRNTVNKKAHMTIDNLSKGPTTDVDMT